MTAVRGKTPFVEALASNQTPGLHPSAWLSTGMGAVPAVLDSTSDPAAFVWRSYTIPQQRQLVMWRHTEIRYDIRREPHVAPNAAEDLIAEGVTHQDFAAWARSMMGGDTSDMLDV